MISTILNALLAIIFVTLLGWVARRLRMLGPRAIPVLSSFNVSFALPLSLFLVAAFWRDCVANAMSARSAPKRRCRGGS